MVTVLVIDSDESMLCLLDTILQRGHNHVLRARTGADGIQAAQSRQPDVILLADRLPQMNSASVCAQLKGHIRTQNIPIILTTTASVSLDYAHQLGADHVLRKPFRLHDVEIALTTALVF
jgi:CheY-like chemotaxis protein